MSQLDAIWIFFSKTSCENYVQNLVCPTFYLLQKSARRCRGLSSLSTDDTNGIPERSVFPQLTPFSKLSKARAFEASVRPRAATFHIAQLWQKSYPRTTCYARHIRCKSTSPKARLLGVEVPNELPLKSNSRHVKHELPVLPRQANLRMHLSINLMNEKSMLGVFDIYWQLTNN